MKQKFVGSVEANGDYFTLAVQDVVAEKAVVMKKIPTQEPEQTLNRCLSFFKQYPVNALGVGIFGPIDINVSSHTYGYILDTPKAGWSNTNVYGYFTTALKIPVTINTEVDASAYGEYIARGSNNTQSYYYLSLGNGIGAGMVQGGHLIGLNANPEIGHTLVKAYPGDDYKGNCPFHKNNCAEGMASLSALEDRAGVSWDKIPHDSKIFNYAAYYVAQVLYDSFLNMRPDVMVIGGRILKENDLFLVRRYFDHFNNHYVHIPDINQLIVSPKAKSSDSATTGNFAMARQLL